MPQFKNSQNEVINITDEELKTHYGGNAQTLINSGWSPYTGGASGGYATPPQSGGSTTGGATGGSTGGASGSGAAGESGTNTDEQNSLAAQLAAIQAQLDAEIQAATGEITSQYNLKRQQQNKLFQQETATNKALQFKLGRSDTLTGAGETSQLVSDQSYRANLLAQEEQELIAKTKEAIMSKNYKKAQDLKDEANRVFEQRMKIVQEERAQKSADADASYKSLQTQKLQKEIIDQNIDSFAGSLISIDATGKITYPEAGVVSGFAAETGYGVDQIMNIIKKKGTELSKLDQEERLREYNIMKAQADLIPKDFQEFNYAVNNGSFKGTFFDYLKQKADANKAPESAPASYKEWQLAGGQEGTGKSYAEFLGNQNGINPKIVTQVDSLARGFDSNQIVKNFVEVQNKKLSVGRIIDVGVGGPGDLALVFEFMKALDPTSVVREAEYDNAAKSGNIFKGWAAKFNGYLKEEGGFLPENVKESFKKIIDEKYGVVAQQYDNLFSETARKINRKTGQEDGADYLTQYKFEPPKYNNVDDFVSKATKEELDKFNKLRQTLPNASPQDLFEFYMEEQVNFKESASSDGNSSTTTVDIGGKKIDISPELAKPLAMADADFFKATGKHFKINEAFRSRDRQAQLYEAYKSGKGGRAAPPGKSFHEKGLAVDIANWKEAEPYLRKYGIKNDLADDKNHFSIKEFV